MRAVFLASKQSIDAVAAWTASFQASGASLRHVAAWSGAGELGRRQHGSSACNVDAFLLGPGATLESHLAQYYGGGTGDSLLLVSLELSPQCPLPRAGVVLLVWQPQVPQDIVQACAAALAANPSDATAGSAAAASAVRGLLLVEASPSLTLSVTHKALEGAGMQALARKPTVLATRTAQAPQAAVQALMQLAEPLPPAMPLLPPPAPPVMRIAVARDDAFGPCFPENLTLLHQAGAQLAFFSPLYDGALPAGATCLYLSSGPLEPERWQQLAANRPLLAGVRAFCEAGGAVLAEGAGLLYLSRTLDLEEGVDDGGSTHCVLDMAGVLPFKARLLAEPQSAPVQLLVTAGNPLLPAGARPRGYLSAQASLFMTEERQVQSLVLPGPPHPHAAGKVAAGPQLSTTYEVSVVRQQGVADSEAVEKDGGAASAAAAPEGYTLQNVLASSCLLFLPSDPGLAAHWLRRCACIDAAALAAGVAQQLGGCGGAVPASAAKLHYQLSSATCSRAGSRRQSIQDVSALTTAYASSSGASASGMLAGVGHHHQYQLHQQQHHFGSGAQQYHQPAASGRVACGQPQGGGGGACTDPGSGGKALCGAANPARPAAGLPHSSSAAGACGLGLAPQAQSQPRRSLCGPAGFPHDTGRLPMPSRSPNPLARSPYASPTTPPMQAGHSGRSSPMAWKDGGAISAESPAGFLLQGWSAHQNQPQQRQNSGLLSYDNELSFKLPQQHQQLHSSSPLPQDNELSFRCYAAAAASSVGQDAVRRKLLDAAVADQRAPALAPDVQAVIGQPTSPRWSRQDAAGATGAAPSRDAVQTPPAPGVQRNDAGHGQGENGAGGDDAPPAVPYIAISRAGSFTDYAPGGSSCSLVDLSYQRRTSGRLEEAGAAAGAPVGYVPWGVTAGSVGVHVGAGASQGCWSPGGVPVGAGAGARHSAPSALLGPLGVAGAHGGGGGGVVCCAPGACEALVAMGLANRLAGIGADCDHPPDVCASRPVVLRWVPAAEAPQGAAARGIRVVPPSTQQQQQHGGGGGGGALGGCRRGGGRASADRSGAAQQRGGGGGGARVLLVDELALRQDPPSVLVLPDMAEMSGGELAQLEQGLVETGLLSASGGPSARGCTVLHVGCRTLVDVMDFMLDLGAAVDEHQAASMLLERLQARMRRVVAAAAAAAAAGALACRLPVTAAAGAAATGLVAAPRRPRVLVLQALQPMVEPGRWVPEMLALAGASSCLAQPGGEDVALTWQDVRERAVPDVLIILTSPCGGAGGTDGGGGSASGQQVQGPGGGGGVGGGALQEQLAALASQPGWWCLPAVRVSKVYLLQSSYCVRPGPRLVDGVELLARLLLPGHYSSSRKVPPGALMRLSLAAGQRCRATLLPSYFVPVTFT